MSHDLLDLDVAHSVACHGNELGWPEVHQVLSLPRRHYNSTGERKSVILEEFVLLEALLCEDLCVVSDGRGVVVVLLGVDEGGWPVTHALDLVISEKYALAEKVSKDVIGADELETPVESVQDVKFHGNELAVSERRLDVLQELGNARVSLLVVLG